jgi:hypothetical protein
VVHSEKLTAWQEGGETIRVLGRRIFTRTAIAEDRQALLLLSGPIVARTITYRRFESTMLSISGRNPPGSEDLREAPQAVLDAYFQFRASLERSRVEPPVPST